MAVVMHESCIYCSLVPQPPSAHKKGSGNIEYKELFQWNLKIAHVTVYHVILHKFSTFEL